MADSNILAGKLRTYHASVESHLKKMDEQYHRLKQSWQRLHEHFQGNSAREFEPVWNGSMTMLQMYQEDAKAIQRILEKQIAELESFDRRSGLLT